MAKPKGPVFTPGNKGGIRPRRPGKKGTRYPGSKKPLLNVPYGAYDPSIDAQMRASRRGLRDLRQDTRIANRWAKSDLAQREFDIDRAWGRGKEDIGRSFGRTKENTNRTFSRNKQQIGTRAFREGQKLGFRQFDLKRDAERGRQDLRSRLEGVGRQFSQLASSQSEAMNASGTLGGGAAAAAAQKRAENQKIAEEPIRTAQTRLGEDLKSNLNRISIAGRQLNRDTRRSYTQNRQDRDLTMGRAREDRNTSLTRGGQDTFRDRKLSRLDYRRDSRTRGLKLSRGVREQKVGEQDLTAQKIWSARQTNPGAFNKYGRKKR